mgnify:FL=1|jgi:hypothetical protein|tara:strand:- start:718 stop:1878 length:1161 start_codon:yes stop_codon:yes gene_type:complete
MPRLSLYKPERGNDFEFLDRQILEMFTVGGTDMFIHKYLGPKNPDTADATADQPQYDAVANTNIQDLLFLENRDRKYDKDVYTMRGIYNVQDVDFDLSQFGLFLQNDTLMLTIHIRSSVKTLGRKIMPGDVIELPHLRDEYAQNDMAVALKRFYVVEDVNRASEGFTQTWYPHLYRLKLKQILDSQEYKDILDLPAEEDAPGGSTLRNLLSTYEKEMQINNAVVAQAEADSAKSGYDTSHLFTLQVDANGETELVTVDSDTIDGSDGINVDTVMVPPEKNGYQGYLLGDGLPPNGEVFGHGISFPLGPSTHDYFLRTDFLPNRLFKYDGTRWIKLEDDVRMALSNTNTKSTLKGGFVNNTTTDTIGGETIQERQSLSKALKAKPDN